MDMDMVVKRFVEQSPVTVMARLALQRALAPEWIDALFEQRREQQYTRKLLFSTTVDWSRAAHDWKQAMNQLAILYAERFSIRG